MHHMGLAVPPGVPTPLEDRVDLLDSQFRTLGRGCIWCGKRPYRTTSASHGGSCGTHDEWWTVCPPQTGSPRPPPPPVSVSPLSVTHNRRPSGRLSLDPLPPPAAESPSNGRALRLRRQFQPYDARSTLWRSPPGGLESVSIILVQFGGVFAATFHPRFRHDMPNQPACLP